MTFRNTEVHARIDPSLADRIEEYLLQTYGMRRRPTAAARLMALIVELHARGMPFPQREAAATEVGCSVFGVDAALSNYLARGELTVEIRTVPGNVQQRESVIREKYYTPSTQLLGLANRSRRGKAA